MQRQRIKKRNNEEVMETVKTTAGHKQRLNEGGKIYECGIFGHYGDE